MSSIQAGKEDSAYPIKTRIFCPVILDGQPLERMGKCDDERLKPNKEGNSYRGLLW